MIYNYLCLFASLLMVSVWGYCYYRSIDNVRWSSEAGVLLLAAWKCILSVYILRDRGYYVCKVYLVGLICGLLLDVYNVESDWGYCSDDGSFKVGVVVKVGNASSTIVFDQLLKSISSWLMIHELMWVNGTSIWVFLTWLSI